MTLNLDREDLMEAISEGVRRGVIDVASAVDSACRPGEQLYKAIQEGVSAAVWQMITNATSMPCADFYEMIKQGVEQAIVRIDPDLSP